MRRPSRVMVVDDDVAVVDWLIEELTRRGFAVEGATSTERALELASAERFDVVVSDVEMPSMRGIDLLHALHARRPDQLVILITAFGTMELALQCMRAGAADFLAKPFPIEALVHAIERTLRERMMRREIVRLRTAYAAEHPRSELVAASRAMDRVMEVARRAAPGTATVLITGESGVGKTALARFIHDSGPRTNARFVQINCAALPTALVEAELFGVRRGAFTDAREDRDGLLVHAHGGTLFLDEISEMPLEVQAKLLVALDTGTFRPIGGRDEQPMDVRFIAATNRPLEDALRERRLRPDLYHRLNVIRIDVPPLRERPEEIQRMVDHWLARLTRGAGRQILGVSDEAMRWLRAQPWPGNIRELGNVLERAATMSDHDVLVLEDFADTRRPADDRGFLEEAVGRGYDLGEVQRRYIQLVVDRCGGNKAAAARILGIDRTTLWRRLAVGSPDEGQGMTGEPEAFAAHARAERAEDLDSKWRLPSVTKSPRSRS